MPIDPRFIDVDFPVESDRLGIGTGDITTPAFTPRFARYSDEIQPIPQSQWRELAEKLKADGGGCSKLIVEVKNQKNEGSCHSADTEVLTESGWVGWPDYNWTERLGTMNPVNGLLEFQTPLQKHVYDYDGELICSGNRSVDFAVTGNHRMFVRRWNERQRMLTNHYEFIEASKLGWYVGLPHSTLGVIGTELVNVAIDGDRQYEGDDFAEFLGVIASDGWAGNSENTRNRVSFCCFNDFRQKMIRDLAARIGFREQPGRPGVWYRQDAPALAAWIRANIYGHKDCGATNKRVPTIIKAASQRQIKLFLKYFGDQSHTREYGAQYYSSSEFLADDLQELSLRIGKRASINRREPRTSSIKGRPVTDHGSFVVTEWGGTELSIIRKKHIITERYRGPVYCATVPNGTLVTRRNKSVLISGNCVGNAWTQQTQIVSAVQFGKPNVTILSACSAYKQIGSSPNSGANIGDALEAGREVGILPLDTPENRARFGDMVMPAIGFRTPWPSGDWKKVAANFRVQEYLNIDSVDELITALLNQHPVVVGRSGHSICYCDPVYDGDKLTVRYANSWGDWGGPAGDFKSGFGYDSIKLINSSARWCYAVRSVVIPEHLKQ